MNIPKTNEQISHISEVFTNILMQRGLLESKLFPVNAYICVSCYHTYYNLYKVMKQVWEKITPEDLAKQSKTLLSEVQGLAIMYQWLYYGLGRMGIIFNKCESDPAKEPAEKREQWRYILENWHRLATSYFNTGKPTIDASGGVNLAWNADSLSWIQDNLQPVSEEQVKKIRRTLGSVDLYAYMEECEARAKICEQGPYQVESGEILIATEYTNLYDGTKPLWLPWSETDAKFPSSSLGVAMTLKDAAVSVMDTGTMTIEPDDYTKLVTKILAYTKRGDKIIPLGLDELPSYAETADNAQMELFMTFSEWDKKELLLAGAKAYWRGFARYTNQVGITDKIDWDISETVQEEYLPYFMEADADPAFLRMFREEEERKKDPTMYLLPE